MKKYDETSPESIESYGKGMIGKTFREIFDAAKDDPDGFVAKDACADYLRKHAQKSRKGGVGNLVEECWFGYEANSDDRPDFPEAGVELKVTPYKQVRKTQLNPEGFAAKERLVLTMINYMEVVKEKDFAHSHLWEKAQLMLLVWYLHLQGRNDIDSTVDYVQLFTPPAEDLEIIREDYEKILTKIRDGRAHELSEGDTLYLGACTKAAKSTDRRQQPYSDILAKPRAFSLKNKYMTYVLNHYIRPGRVTYEPAVRGKVSDFEAYIIETIGRHRGESMEELRKRYGIETHPKNLGAMLAYRMLGIKGNHCAEFEKAGIAIKSIRIQENGCIKENMSFPPISYQKLAKETWEDCTFGNYLRETRFFFVVYREDRAGALRLAGCCFWNVPVRDLEGDIRAVWQETHDIIADGRLVLDIDAKGNVTNNLPKKHGHPIAHVRPHGRNRADTAPLPEGTYLAVRGNTAAWLDDTAYTKQCFWLNNDYIRHQLQLSGM
ncbi:Sau3AI family type II restriction endonuclease [uncultured Selenomonas sp.]|uniref:Sau3AI family type II restriction endonuclease n=1 Tax=uncultured Selenomonas sp. TaxID=159275 RepID=UPI0025CBC690|nr:Sau3AI family type II restriction endonuclease [uncultured Selenomonas sp.]